MNKVLILVFVVVASCLPKNTQSEPIALVEALPEEAIVEFIPEAQVMHHYEYLPYDYRRHIYHHNSKPRGTMKKVTIRTRQPNGIVVKKTTTPQKLPKSMTTFHYEGEKRPSK